MDQTATPAPNNDLPASGEPTDHVPGQLIGPAATPVTAPVSDSATPSSPVPETEQAGHPQVFQPTFTEVNQERPLGVTGPDPSAAMIVGSGTVIGHNDQEIAAPTRRKWLGKRVVIPVAAVFVLLGGSAAAYLGYYVPNKPENVWKTALSRTGKGYQKLSDYIVGYGKTASKGETYSGSLKFSGGFTADGSFQGTSDGANSQTAGSFSTSGINAKFDLRTIQSPAGSPDVYFKLDGLQGLGDLLGGGDPTYTSLINGINGNWYFVDHSLINQYASQASGSDNLTSTDLKNFLNAIYTPTNSFVFNADPTKAVLVVKQTIGKEKQDSRNVIHYKVGVNKDNLKDYNNALCDSMSNNKIFKLLSGSDPSALASCKDTSDIDRIKDSDTADIWVDTHTKLIHRVRFTLDSGATKSNLDIGQDFQGGDEMPFFLDYKQSGQDSTVTIHADLKLNTSTNKLSIDGTFNATGRTASDKENGEIKFNLQPRGGNLKVENPANAKNVIQLLNDLGISQVYQGVQSQAKDTERKTDIKAMQGHIEAYWADNGFYPTLANLNDQAWVAANFKGLDAEALKDPDGTSQKLVSTPASHVYAYQPTPAGCNNTTIQCADYTLTATLDSGGTFVVQSNNSDTGAPVYQN